MTALPHTWHGPADAPQLVLGNSFGTTQRMWDPLRRALGDGFRVLTFDLPGHREVESAEFTFDDLVDRSAETLRAAGVSAAAYCGVSLGGALGVALAARHPGLLSRLVVVNAPVRQSSAQFWLDRAAVAERDGLEPFVATLAERWFPADVDPAVVAPLVADLRGIPAFGYAQACRALALLDVTADAPRVSVPTTVVRGDADVAVPAENARELARTIPGAELHIFPGAAHLLPVDAAEELATLLTDPQGASA